MTINAYSACFYDTADQMIGEMLFLSTADFLPLQGVCAVLGGYADKLGAVRYQWRLTTMTPLAEAIADAEAVLAGHLGPHLILAR